MRILFACALMLLAPPTGAQQASGCDSLQGSAIEFGLDWQGDIKPIINEMISSDGRCTSCHNGSSPAGGLDLSDSFFDAIYTLVPTYVTPGRPAQSELFLRVNCAQPPQGARMPFQQTPLSIEQQGRIYDWINQGARGEDGEFGSIPRDFVFRDGGESLR